MNKTPEERYQERLDAQQKARILLASGSGIIGLSIGGYFTFLALGQYKWGLLMLIPLMIGILNLYGYKKIMDGEWN